MKFLGLLDNPESNPRWRTALGDSASDETVREARRTDPLQARPEERHKPVVHQARLSQASMTAAMGWYRPDVDGRDADGVTKSLTGALRPNSRLTHSPLRDTSPVSHPPRTYGMEMTDVVQWLRPCTPVIFSADVEAGAAMSAAPANFLPRSG